MPPKLPMPLCRAILLADQIITDIETGKKSLIGIYSHVVSPKIPCTKNISIYGQLSDMQGEYTIVLEMINLKTGALVHRGNLGPVVADNRLAPVDIVMRMPCRFDSHGAYEFRLMYEGHVFGSREISVVAPQNQGANNNGQLEESEGRIEVHRHVVIC
ncbi:MAG: hypothetical protein JXR97_12075 [Planctomycetes bacterium]|nr:hypothetical protein [Planctomycetota bacterium]